MSSEALLGVGLDAEKAHRFVAIAHSPQQSWDHVFSRREWQHALSLENPAPGLCAAFCCKEALVKALEECFELRDCELLYQPACKRQTLWMPTSFLASKGVSRVDAAVDWATNGECVATVCLFGEKP